MTPTTDTLLAGSSSLLVAAVSAICLATQPPMVAMIIRSTTPNNLNQHHHLNQHHSCGKPPKPSSRQRFVRGSSPWILLAVYALSCPRHMAMSITTTATPRIAVIGAGAAGLAAARVISRETGCAPIVLEKDPQEGGVWRYVPKSKDRPMYFGLRTNLPKELMAFREFPFAADDDDYSFVTHQQVHEYLVAYQQHFGLHNYIRYQCHVQDLQILKDTKSRLSPSTKEEEAWPTIRLEWKDITRDTTESQVFDAVLVCNGHYALPSIPPIPGLDQHFQGRVLHSIEYDTPCEFADQTVLCIGGRASGADLARELVQHAAKHVYVSDPTVSQMVQDGKVTVVPKTISVEPGGRIRFDKNCPLAPTDIDTIIFCTGYDYEFPFMKELPDFSAGERRVQPLYEQLWHAQYPSLTFVGLPHSVVPFPLFEFQVEAICAQWRQYHGPTKKKSNKQPRLLPPLAERLVAAQQDATRGGPNGGRVQDTHFLGDYQWDYCWTLVQMASSDKSEQLEAYIRTNQEIYNHVGKFRKAETPGGPDGYRSIRYERPSWDQWRVLGEDEVRVTKKQQQQPLQVQTRTEEAVTGSQNSIRTS